MSVKSNLILKNITLVTRTQTDAHNQPTSRPGPLRWTVKTGVKTWARSIVVYLHRWVAWCGRLGIASQFIRSSGHASHNATRDLDSPVRSGSQLGTANDWWRWAVCSSIRKSYRISVPPRLVDFIRLKGLGNVWLGESNVTAARQMLKKIGARLQPCLTTKQTVKGSDWMPPSVTRAAMSVRNSFKIFADFGGQPALSRTSQWRSRLTESEASVRSMKKAKYRFWALMVLMVYSALSCSCLSCRQYCVDVGNRTEIRENNVNNMLKKT